MRAFTVGACALPLLATAAGCDGRTGAVTHAMVRDSAGVEIVMNEATRFDELPRLRVAPEPELTIGAIEGDSAYLFHRLLGMTRLSDGRIAVLDGGSAQVRYFNERGDFLHAIGGRGDGPAEFRLPLALRQIEADSVVVHDVGARRLTFIDGHGRFARTQPTGMTLSGFAGLLDARTAVLSEPSFPRVTDERLIELHSVVRLIHLDSGVADTIAQLGGRLEYQLLVGERVFSVPVPYTVHPATRVAGSHVYIVDGRDTDVRVFDRTGGLVRIVRVAEIPAELDPDAFRRAADRQLADVEPARFEHVRRAYDRVPRPAHVPIYDALVVAADASIWARTFDADPDAATRAWRVFDADGRARATVLVPAALSLIEAGADWILGAMTDALGVEYVQLFRVSPDGAAGSLEGHRP